MHEHDVTGAGEVVRRSATGVVRSAEPGSPRVGVGTEVDQLLSTDRPHTAMTVHAENAGQRLPYAGRTEQPGAGVGAVANGPAQPADQDPIPALSALVVHSRWVR